MSIPMDGAGRLVVPKPLRNELGIVGPTQIEIIARDGVRELAVADASAQIEERGGAHVIVTGRPMTLRVDDARDAIDLVRR